MERLIGAIVGIVFVIAILIVLWKYILAVLLIGGLIWIIVHQVKKEDFERKQRLREENEAEAKRRWLLEEEEKERVYRDEQERERKEREYREEQDKIRAHELDQRLFQIEFGKVSGAALATFEALPRELLKAEVILNQAELDFKEEAFSPFWDSIEEAAKCLGRFDEGVVAIGHNLEQYKNLAGKYEGKAPGFPIVNGSVRGLAAGNATVGRMKTLVRQAQRNFQFASIYEQRKTNNILLAGFTSLAQALSGMEQRVAASIEGLSCQISTMSEAVVEVSDEIRRSSAGIVEALDANAASVSGAVSNMSENTQSSSAELAERLGENASAIIERHDKALEMLEEIRERRFRGK